jgi:hypothetical protein
MNRLSFALIVMALLAGCSMGISATVAPPPNTGIAGTVTLGPMCPVMRADQPCPDQPYEATVTIMESSSGQQVAQAHSDAQGFFQIALMPGTYILHPETPADNIFPTAGEQTITVTSGQIIQVMISYDTGIR